MTTTENGVVKASMGRCLGKTCLHCNVYITTLDAGKSERGERGHHQHDRKLLVICFYKYYRQI